MEIITYEIPQQVKVRTFSVDCEKLCDCLREHKARAKINNKQIAKTLGVPLTMVEHWFRKDGSFSIPLPELWHKIKSLLEIHTTEFDEAILTFEEKEGVFERGNRIYDELGIAPTITSVSAIVILQRSDEMEKRLGNIFGYTGGNYSGNVYDENYIAPTLNTMQGGCKQPMIVAMRGRYTDNLSNETEQRLEPNNQGICNTLTSVQKDNLVMETVRIKQATKEGYTECKVGGVADLSYPTSTTRRGRVQESGDICPTLTATETGVCKIENLYRIRKLTPKECWRLMAFTDEDFHKAEAVNSNTQLYKQAGNSIVVSVLEAIFRQMNIQNIPTWNEEVATHEG